MYRLLVLSIALLSAGCASTASMKDFPRSSAEVDFQLLEEIVENNPSSLRRTLSGQWEYLIQTQNASESELLNALRAALGFEGYHIEFIDTSEKVVIGVRDTTLWEWKSIVGIYFKETEESDHVYLVYFKNRITQDITGGFNFNRAQKVADRFCDILKKSDSSVIVVR
jgi:hypothetical protein